MNPAFAHLPLAEQTGFVFEIQFYAREALRLGEHVRAVRLARLLAQAAAYTTGLLAQRAMESAADITAQLMLMEYQQGFLASQSAPLYAAAQGDAR